MMPTPSIDRRTFLQVAGAAASAAALAACSAELSLPPLIESFKIPRRTLGKTGRRLSIVGFGGIVVMNETPEKAAEYVQQAIERDINYFDVAPAYGNAETRLGPALEPYRKDVFLACKTQQRTRQGAERELKRSLERLRTDHFDVYQFHAVQSLSEVDMIFGEGGAMEAFLDARDKGLIQFIGFSAHSEEAALAMLDRFQFDTILYPVNWVCWYGGEFGTTVVPKAQEQGLGILALKSLAKQAGQVSKWPKCWYEPVDTPAEVATNLSFTLTTKPVTAAVSPSHAELLWMMCDAAEQLQPMSKEDEAQLAAQAANYSPIFTA